MKIERLGIDAIAQKLDDKGFSFVRYGDGEFNAIMGVKGQNCDGQVYTTRLGADLIRTLTHPRPFTYAIGPKAYRVDVVKSWVDRFSKVPTWASTEVLSEAAVSGNLGVLLDKLRQKRIVYVGPARLRTDDRVANLFRFVDYVEVPERDAYGALHQTEAAIRESVERHKPDVVGFSCGMTSNVLIYRLWPAFMSTTFFDFGSVFDVFAGYVTRSYHKRVNVEATLSSGVEA